MMRLWIPPPTRRREAVRALWLLSIVVVIVGSVLPADSLAIRTLDRLPVTDKIEHTAMYAVLAFLPAIYERRSVVITAAAGAIALGVALEFVQLLSGWRQFEIGDMVADAIGVCLGLAFGVAARTRLPLRIAPDRAR
jgi:VanZ family protein